MLRLIEGGFYSQARGELIKEISTLVNNKRRCYLVVPEQQALTTEKEMTDILPSFAPLYFEVTNFSRFANSVFRSLGGISKEYVDRAKRMVVMWQTLSVLAPILDMTKSKKEINVGMVDKAISAVTKMQSASIEADELLCACENERLNLNKRLRSKLSDLSKIMTLYKQTLQDKYNDTGDDVSLLCSLLLENPDYLRDEDVYFEGFCSFTEPQYRLIGILAERARVHVALTLPKLFSSSVEYKETALAERRLKRLASKSGAEIKITHIEAPRSNAPELLRGVCEGMWQSFIRLNTEDYTEKELSSLRILEASTPYEACDFLGADIKRRVMNGARYKDFAVICRDTDEYAGILSSSLAAYDVPSFISMSRDITDFEAIKLINSAYRVIATDFSSKEVLSYAKCSLCGISRDACDEFEEYIFTWQLSGRRFYDGVLWNMSPRGLTETSEEDEEALARINATRDKIILPLVSLKESLVGAKTVREHATHLFGFLTQIGLEDAILLQGEELIRVKESALAEDTVRLFKIICDSLDMLVDTVGEVETTRDGFLNLLSIAFSSAKVSKIPSHLDEGTIGSADVIMLSSKKHVYLLGVNNGEFPRSVKDHAYFNDREKEMLSEFGLSLSPEVEIDYSRELFSFSRAFSYATDSVTLIYSKAMRDFSKCDKAPIIDRIVEMCDQKVAIEKISELSPLSFIYTKRSALSALGRLSDCEFRALKPMLEATDASELIRIADRNIENDTMQLSSEALSEIYSSDIGLSQSRLEKYNSCPLSYFCNYNLKLDNGERARFDARNIGSFIHSILENFFREVKENNISIKELEKEKREEMVNRHARAYIESISADTGIVSNARAEVMINRLTRSAIPVVEGLCTEFEGCDFVPTYFELDIGKSKTQISPSPVKYKTESGKGVYVAGVIDRVDTYKSGDDVYVRVVDYKTGKKEFSPDDIDEGENLQMFLYLKAICDTKNESFRRDIGVGENGRLIPAGVIYVKTDLSDVTVQSPSEELAFEAVQKKQSRKGMILNDPVSINAMNKEYVPVRFSSTGAPDKRTEKNLYTEEGWEDISRRVEKSVVRIASDMESGNVSPTPKKSGDASPCEYCPYKPICRRVVKK